MSLSKEDLAAISELLEKKLDDKIAPIQSRLDSMDELLTLISSDLGQIRRDLGYHNLVVLKRKDQEEM